MGFPIHRMRRLRRNQQVRRMVRENTVNVADLILPLFVVHGSKIREPIAPLPGSFHLSVDTLVEEAKRIRDLGIPAILLFGVPAAKDETGSEAYRDDGISQQALRALKKSVPDLILIADTCQSLYTPGGHSGIVKDGVLQNDPSLAILASIAVAQAEAGADIVAPSAMLDGQIHAMRTALDQKGFLDTAIMSYSTKMASRLYDPFFKQGEEASVSYDVKKTHLIDCANGDEAVRESELDVGEGADILMVKPGMFCLDLVYRCKQRFAMPLAVYQVSGEYAMMMAAQQRGFLDKKALMYESLIAIKRAGGDMIITYFAQDAARALASGEFYT